jgi:predicted metal-dependent peptidase
MIKDIIRISKELLYEKPFYGSVLLSLHKEVSEKVPTAGVGLQGIMFKLLVNPTFWQTLSDKHKEGLILHELGHIINFHLTEFNHLKNKEVANYAMDLVINQTIPADMLPEGGLTLDKFEGMLPNKSTNWYYDKLMENQENESDETLKNLMAAAAAGEGECKDGDGNQMEVPSHEWDEIEAAPDPIKKMLAKNAESLIRNIVKQMAPGSVPGGIEELLDEIAKVEPPKFNWRAFMKTFVGVSTKTWVNKTRRKKSRRFKGMPGSKEFYFSNILVAIDTSASVDEDDLREFQNELRHMHKTGHDIEIIMCDTKINDQFKYNPRKPFTVKGRGGTSFQPVIDHFNENFNKYSCLIYLTDGEASNPENAKGKILWVHSTQSYLNEDLPGRCIKLN